MKLGRTLYVGLSRRVASKVMKQVQSNPADEEER
jgi:hypothetical protein